MNSDIRASFSHLDRALTVAALPSISLHMPNTSSKNKTTRKRQVRSSSDESNHSGSRSGEDGNGNDEERKLRETLDRAQLRMQRAEELAAEREEELRQVRAQLDAQNANAGRPAPRNRRGTRNRLATPADPPANDPPAEPHNANPDGRPAEPANRPGAAAGADAQNAPNPAVAERLLKIEHNHDLIRLASRRCCVLHYPFMEPDFLTDNTVRQGLPQIIQALENKIAAAAENGDAEEEEGFWDEPRFEMAEPIDIVQEIISTLPIELGKLWFHPQFQKLFHTGYRKMKSEAASEVANARHIVFKMTGEEFGERSDDRKRGDAAKALFENSKYIFAPATDAELQEALANNRDPARGPRFFRNGCLINACQVIIAGLSAAESATNRASTKARKSRGAMWKVTSVTPSILTFTSLVVHFVLSGDPEFLAQSRTTNFADLWSQRMELLEKHHRKKRALYNEMVRLFNIKVFPKYHQAAEGRDPVALGEEERRLRQELSEED